MIAKRLSAFTRVLVFVIFMPACLRADDARVGPNAGQDGDAPKRFNKASSSIQHAPGQDAAHDVLRPAGDAIAQARREDDAFALLLRWQRSKQPGFSGIVKPLRSEDIFVDARVYGKSDGQEAWKSVARGKAQTYVPLELRFIMIFLVAGGEASSRPGLAAYLSGLDCHPLPGMETSACLELWCKRWLEQRLGEAKLSNFNQQKVDAIAHVAAARISRELAEARKRYLTTDNPKPPKAIQAMLAELTDSLDGEDSILRKFLNSEIAKHEAASAVN